MWRGLTLPFLGGCALIVNGTTDRVPIESDPPGATIFVDGAAVARTPAKIDVTRGHPQRITVSKDGFEPEEVMLERRFDAGFLIFDIILTAGIGIPIDIATGAIYTVYPGRVSLRLRVKR